MKGYESVRENILYDNLSLNNFNLSKRFSRLNCFCFWYQTFIYLLFVLFPICFFLSTKLLHCRAELVLQSLYSTSAWDWEKAPKLYRVSAYIHIRHRWLFLLLPSQQFALLDSLKVLRVVLKLWPIYRWSLYWVKTSWSVSSGFNPKTAGGAQFCTVLRVVVIILLIVCKHYLIRMAPLMSIVQAKIIVPTINAFKVLPTYVYSLFLVVQEWDILIS